LFNRPTRLLAAAPCRSQWFSFWCKHTAAAQNANASLRSSRCVGTAGPSNACSTKSVVLVHHVRQWTVSGWLQLATADALPTCCSRAAQGYVYVIALKAGVCFWWDREIISSAHALLHVKVAPKRAPTLTHLVNHAPVPTTRLATATIHPSGCTTTWHRTATSRCTLRFGVALNRTDHGRRRYLTHSHSRW
jgi:hypothetical protein